MTDSGAGAPGPAREQPEERQAPAWHSFGVPHGGAPEPPAYTPAMRERGRGDLTQPLDPAGPGGSGSGEDGRPADPTERLERPDPSEERADGSRPWWTTPGQAGQTGQTGQTGQSAGSTAGTTPLAPPPGGPSAGVPTSAPPPSGEPYQQPAWASRPEGGGHPAYPTYPAYPPSGGYTGPQPYAFGGPATTTLPAPAPPGGGPVGPGRTGRGRLWVPLVVVALLAAVLGGAVALVGQQLLSRGTTLGSAVPAPGPGSTSRPDGSIAKIAADALPSVVTIRIKSADGSGTGSGFVLDNQGHILTNNHVANAGGGSGTLTVELNNGKSLSATIVGADASYDLAVLKVDATDLPPLQFGASKDVVVGDGVIAVGAPLGLDATVTSGIVSALNRPVSAGDGNDQSFINAIQTDAAINPGNSGGPLLDMNGRVIGVNSAIARVPGSSSDTGGNIGVGFAIPSDQAAKTAQQLITTGKADHPALGVRVDQSFTGDGAKIAPNGVSSGSAAASAGLQDGDVIVALDGQRVPDANSLIVGVRSRSVGDTVKLTVQRGGQTLDLSLKLQSSATS